MSENSNEEVLYHCIKDYPNGHLNQVRYEIRTPQPLPKYFDEALQVLLRALLKESDSKKTIDSFDEDEDDFPEPTPEQQIESLQNTVIQITKDIDKLLNGCDWAERKQIEMRHNLRKGLANMIWFGSRRDFNREYPLTEDECFQNPK